MAATAGTEAGEGDEGLLTEDSKRLTFLCKDEDGGDDDDIFFLRRGTSDSLLLSPLPTEFTARVEEIRSGVNTLPRAGP